MNTQGHHISYQGDEGSGKKIVHRDAITKIKKDAGIDVKITDDQLSTDEKEIVDNLKELIVPDREIFINRKSKLTQNITKLYGIDWGQ